MINQTPFRASKSRVTRQEEASMQINALIIAHMRRFPEPQDAETIWLELKADNMDMSISTFYNRIRKLVEIGAVEKKSIGYNKYAYAVVDPL